MDTTVGLNRLIDAQLKPPRIAGTDVTIRQVARSYWRGRSPGDIARRTDPLSRAEVHAALAYYYAHQDAVDADLEEESARDPARPGRHDE